MKIGIIIPAAGQGTRMNTDQYKQFLKLNNYPIIVHTLKIFLKNFDFEEIVTVVPPDKMEYCQNEIIKKYNINRVKLVKGGKNRRESVYFGLKAFSQSINYVIIHDGVRPLVPLNIIRKISNMLNKYKAVITGVKVKDTIKVQDDHDFVSKTLDRSKLIAVQTPQAFSYDLILKAHETVSFEENIYDDASLVEKIGHAVKIIEGAYKNFKITTANDLRQAECFLQKQIR